MIVTKEHGRYVATQHISTCESVTISADTREQAISRMVSHLRRYGIDITRNTIAIEDRTGEAA